MSRFKEWLIKGIKYSIKIDLIVFLLMCIVFIILYLIGNKKIKTDDNKKGEDEYE